MDSVAPLTAEEENLYGAIDFDPDDYAKDIGTSCLLHKTKEKLLQHRWRFPSLSLHGIEVRHSRGVLVHGVYAEFFAHSVHVRLLFEKSRYHRRSIEASSSSAKTSIAINTSTTPAASTSNYLLTATSYTQLTNDSHPTYMHIAPTNA